jgi:hypothetical protein
MKLRLFLAVIAAVAATTVALTVPGATAATTPGLTVSCVDPSCLTQTTTGTVNGVTYNLTSTVTGFRNVQGALFAVVRTVGTATDALGNVTNIGPITSLVPVTALSADGSCTILTLDLGPLHLDLLGLVVDLSAIHLKITGQTGPGNLLGNLLCGLANALNGSQAGGLATLLNLFLRQL